MARVTRLVLGWMLSSGVCLAADSPNQYAQPIPDDTVQKFYASVSPPNTIPELLTVLVTLAQSGVCSRWDFYSASTMTRIFGDHVVPKLSDDGIVTNVSGHGYLNLVAGPDETTRKLPYLGGIWISAGKPDANGWPFCCRWDAEFWGDIPGLDFNSVMHVLGAGWQEDRKAELREQLGRAEPFNPPPPPVTGYMGNAIMTYASRPEIQLSLSFDSSGRLHNLHAIWPKMAGQEKTPSMSESAGARSPADKAGTAR